MRKKRRVNLQKVKKSVEKLNAEREFLRSQRPKPPPPEPKRSPGEEEAH